MAKKNTKKANLYSKEQVLHWYKDMLTTRRFEQAALQNYGPGKIRGFLHVYIGQEAVGAGIESAIRKTDYVITAYRDHGNGLSRGMDMNMCMAELYGKVTGSSKGNGGSMHFFSKEHRFLGGHGIVGGQIPLGAGIAFACKYNDTDDLCVCLMGDGAVRQGAFHEAFNMAMTWKLPVLYICENNMYAMGTSVERTSNVTDIHLMAEGYLMPHWAVDGMDVKEVHEQVSKAVEHIRAGNGPVFLEIKTYRYQGHSVSDAAKYRTKEELEKYKSDDAIAGIKHYALENNIATDEEFQVIEGEIVAAVAEAVTFAETSPLPEPSQLYEYVYKGDYPFIMD
ncbi:MAG: pyruvate dehydrogenase (acetyl-transferring) E1 component subunit alpha [Bacteroidia bacterium]